MPRLPEVFSAEPIIAWRVWSLVGLPEADRYLLGPLNYSGWLWSPPGPIVAGCLRKSCPTDEHRSPDPWGTCGLYAKKDLGIGGTAPPAGGVHLVAYTWAVVGTVALWGRVIEHEDGYRAQFAYPQQIRVVCAHCLEEGILDRTPDVLIGTPGVPHAGLIPRCLEHLKEEEAQLIRASASLAQSRLLSQYSVDPLPARGP